MECENCEGPEARALLRVAPMVALVVAALGAGVSACARRRHHRRHHEGPSGSRGYGHAHHDGAVGDDARRGDRGGTMATVDGDAFEILAQRFANGEMDEDEFRRRRSVLSEFAR